MTKRTVLVVVMVTLRCMALAQTTLTLEQCLERAERNSPALRAGEIALRTSELAKSELSTTGLPQVKVVAGGTYAPIPPRFGYDPVLSNGGQLAGQVVVKQSLFDGGVRSIRSDQMQVESDRLARERQRTHRDLVFAVRQSFIETMRAQHEVILQRQGVIQLSEYLNLVQRLYTGGGASYTDVLKTDVQFANANLSFQKADESLAIARYSLSQLIGTSVDSSVSLTGSLDSLVSASSATTTAADFLPVNNLDLTIAGLGITRSILDVELTRRERLPLISLLGDAGYLNSGENLRLPPADRLNAFGYSVGIGIEFPLFTWGATGLRVEQREYEVESLRFQMEILRRTLVTEFQKTRLQLEKAKDRLRTVRATITKAEQNFLLTKSKFAGGVSLSLEVLSAQQLFTDATLAELQTLADIQILAARLDQLNPP